MKRANVGGVFILFTLIFFLVWFISSFVLNKKEISMEQHQIIKECLSVLKKKDMARYNQFKLIYDKKNEDGKITNFEFSEIDAKCQEWTK